MLVLKISDTQTLFSFFYIKIEREKIQRDHPRNKKNSNFDLLLTECTLTDSNWGHCGSL